MYILRYKRGEKVYRVDCKSEREMFHKVDELKEDDRITSIRYFKEITWGEQMNLFDSKLTDF